MPANSAKVKVDAVREYGGQVEFVDVGTKSRAERVGELAKEHPEAYAASAYDDPPRDSRKQLARHGVGLAQTSPRDPWREFHLHATT